MAKQTFTTGQVLTAAQMTSLQQTAMGGGAATAKTANYVLVAADAGTTVAMDAAGATTITVNTGLFAAGDTVFIQNLGAGACTVTAGTATVATAGSLILPQNDAGILYFTSPSAAIFYDYIQVGAASPLTTKGDLYTYGTSDTRLGVGANGTTLVADSGETTGLKWATPAAGGWTLLSTTTLSGATTTLTGLSSQTYQQYVILATNIDPSTDATVSVDCNATNNNGYFGSATATTVSTNTNKVFSQGTVNYKAGSQANVGVLTISNAKEDFASNMPFISYGSYINPSDVAIRFLQAGVFAVTSITSIIFSISAGTFNGGTVKLYGVK